MNTKQLIVAGALLPLLALSQVTPALAQTQGDSMSPSAHTTQKHHSRKASHKKINKLYGVITSLDTSSFILSTKKLGPITIRPSSQTKFIDKLNKTLDPSLIQVGDKVTASGKFDKTASTMTQVTTIKDSTQTQS